MAPNSRDPLPDLKKPTFVGFFLKKHHVLARRAPYSGVLEKNGALLKKVEYFFIRTKRGIAFSWLNHQLQASPYNPLFIKVKK